MVDQRQAREFNSAMTLADLPEDFQVWLAGSRRAPANDSEPFSETDLRGRLPQEVRSVFMASLTRRNTLRLPVSTRVLIRPRNRGELVAALEALQHSGIPRVILGGGSNLFFAQPHFGGAVVDTSLMTAVVVREESIVADAGVPMPRLVRAAARQGLGGFEYLVSVPGTVGGGIFTNAGRGRRLGLNLSDWVESVDVYTPGGLQTLTRAECEFGFRWSVFQRQTAWVILGARLRALPAAPAEVDQRIRIRMDWVRRRQHRDKPNAGSVFKAGYRIDNRALRAGGAGFSNRTRNWIVNLGGATSSDVLKLLSACRQAHLARGLPAPTLEWQVV